VTDVSTPARSISATLYGIASYASALSPTHVDERAAAGAVGRDLPRDFVPFEHVLQLADLEIPARAEVEEHEDSSER